MNRFLLATWMFFTFLLLPVSAATYDIGPGQPLTNIGQVAMHDLQAGDLVRIHWRAEPYREKFRISGAGTSNQPIRVIGIPGPNGERPVIDGENATTHPGDVWPHFDSGNATNQSLEDLGVVMIIRGPDTLGDFKPKHILFSGFEVRHGRETYTFTDANGETRRHGGSGVYILGAEDVTIENCKIHDNGDGLFAKSNGDEATATRRIKVLRCHIENNSEVPPPPPAFAFASHNVYTECFDILFEGNYFGPTRPGSDGGNLKDRSSGVVIRYNWIEGGLRLIDLVEAQDAWPMAQLDPAYRRSEVYGNYLVSGPGQAGTAVHYGGDSGSVNTYRKGRLDFHHNTVVFRRDQSEAYRVRVFELTSNDESIYAWNNVFYRESATPGATPTLLYLTLTEGIHHFGPNWVSSGWGSWDNGLTGTGQLNGLTNLTSIGGSPGFVNIGAKDFRLGAYSALRDIGAALPTNAVPVTNQYAFHSIVETRPVVGAPDLGANEFLPPAGPVVPEAHPQQLNAVQGQPLPITLSGYDGNGDTLSFIVTSQPVNGVLTGTPPNLVYTAFESYIGTDTFQFVARDAALTSTPATVTLLVDRPRFTLTVQGGSGDGSYTAGTVVPLVADAAPTGQAFISWAGAAVANPTSNTTTLVMPASDTTVAALFRPVPPPGGPFTLNVGPGQAYTNLSSVPWTRLFPGDTVRVHARETPYAEKILIPSRGTAMNPIRILGIPGTNGQRPVISGVNAITGTNTAFASWDVGQYLGLVTIARAEGDSEFFKPGYIEFSGFELRDVFATPEGVTNIVWFAGAAAIRIIGAENVLISNCRIHDIPNGIIAPFGGTEFGLTRELTIERCHIFNIGTVNAYSSANVFTEVAGLSMRFCQLDPPVNGSFADNLLDRSAGTVIEACRLEGGVRMLQLEAPVGSGSDLIRNDPRFSLTKIAGCLILNTHPDAQPVYCGANINESGLPRTGTLAFIHNTVIISNGAYQINVPVVADTLTVDFRGNIVHRADGGTLQLMGNDGTLHAGANWMSSGWQSSATAIITGTLNVISSMAGPALNGLLEPAAGSPCLDVLPSLAFNLQYRGIADGIRRGIVGAGADLGAFEAGLAPSGPAPQLASILQSTGITVRVAGVSNTVYRLMRSSDLKTWIPVSEKITPGSGIADWIAEPSSDPVGFFRTD